MHAGMWTAGAAITQTFIFGAAAVFAYRQAREIQLTRQDQIRPFVIVDFDLSHPPFIDLVIKNIGQTMAHRVRIKTDPPLRSTLDDKTFGQIAELRVFTDEIPTMAPGREIRMLFDSFPPRVEQKLEDAYRVTITYEGERSRSYRPEEIILDLGIYQNITQIDRHTIHDVHKQLKTIADEVRRWSASGSGIKIVSRKDQREDHALAIRHFRTRPESSLAPCEAAEETVHWTLRRLRQRASRALAIASEKVEPDA